MSTSFRDPALLTSVGSDVRSARKVQGMSLRELARRVGVSPATLSQIENGKTGLSVLRLGEIADALGMAASDILERKPPMMGWEEAKPSMNVAGASPALPPNPVPSPDWRKYEPLNLSPVLTAAVEEILQVGYHASSMRSISGRCGLSVPGIYNYFKSKQDILMTILKETMDDLERRTRGALTEGGDPVEKFCFLIENLALYHTHRRELGFIGASEMRALMPGNREIIAAQRNWQQSVVDEQVLAAEKSGRFRVDHPEDASRSVVTMCTALSSWWRPGGRMTAEQIAQLYVKYSLDLMRFTE
jgi:AcrR family transcriptional regulator